MILFCASSSKIIFRKVFSTLVTGVLVGTGALHAQSILGSWQGTLPASENPRIVLRIAGDSGSLHGVLYRIDQSAEGIRLSSVDFVNAELNVAQINLDMTFSGKMSTDGKSIAGTWTLGKQTYPVTLQYATTEMLWKHDAIAPLAPMLATADPAFEVATIKPTALGTARRGSVSTRHFDFRNYTTADLIEFAYNVRLRLIDGGPAWLNEAKFDIAGEPDVNGQPSVDQYRLMVRKLLAERFQLKIHTVQRVFPVYALTVEKNPPKVQSSDPEFNNRASIYTKEVPDGMMQIQFVGHSMPEFVDVLMNFVQDRQIVDETNLSGHFDFSFSVPASELQGSHGSGPDDSRADTMQRGIQTLGFRLVPKKDLLDVIVIDRIERPSEN